MNITRVGIDMGTSRIRICVEGKGTVVDESSAIAFDSEGKVIAIGKRAFNMIDKTPPGINVSVPVCNGSITDSRSAAELLRYLLSRACRNTIMKPTCYATVSADITGLEKKAVEETLIEAGTGRVNLIESGMAASAGCGISKDRPDGVMVIDIGAGKTEISIVSMGRIIESTRIPVCGNSMDEAVVRYVKRERDIIIGNRTAEDLKIRIGGATLREVELGMTIKGKSNITGVAVVGEVTSKEVYLAMRGELEKIILESKNVLQDLNADLQADILTNGIILVGGMARLRGIDAMFEKKLGINVRVAADPENCIITGLGTLITEKTK